MGLAGGPLNEGLVIKHDKNLCVMISILIENSCLVNWWISFQQVNKVVEKFLHHVFAAVKELVVFVAADRRRPLSDVQSRRR